MGSGLSKRTKEHRVLGVGKSQRSLALSVLCDKASSMADWLLWSALNIASSHLLDMKVGEKKESLPPNQ